jgi:hypothetical protein
VDRWPLEGGLVIRNPLIQPKRALDGKKKICLYQKTRGLFRLLLQTHGIDLQRQLRILERLPTDVLPALLALGGDDEHSCLASFFGQMVAKGVPEALPKHPKQSWHLRFY